MRLHAPLTLLCVLAAFASPAVAFGQEPEPEEPEPVDFWTAYLPPDDPDAQQNAGNAPAEQPSSSTPAPAATPAPSSSSSTGSRPAQAAQGEPYCDPHLVIRQTGLAASKALAKRTIIGTPRRSLTFSTQTCAAGRLEVRLVDVTTSTTVAIARRSIPANVPAKLHLRQTSAGLRWERRLLASSKRRYALQLNVRFVPDATA